MLTLSPLGQLGLLVTFMIALILSSVCFWRAGRASYFNDLKQSHFESWGYDKANVAARLTRYSQVLADMYDSKDLFLKDLAKACAENNRPHVSKMSAAIVGIDSEIQGLWTKRHETEATAKLMGFGKLVDDIHAKGIPSPEQSPK